MYLTHKNSKKNYTLQNNIIDISRRYIVYYLLNITENKKNHRPDNSINCRRNDKTRKFNKILFDKKKKNVKKITITLGFDTKIKYI